MQWRDCSEDGKDELRENTVVRVSGDVEAGGAHEDEGQG